MVSQIKRLKLLKMYSDNNIFDPVFFKDGVNIILGEKFNSETTSGSKTNGVGKSILIQFINFCLLSRYKGSRVSKIPLSILPDKENINLDLMIGDDKFTISRNRAENEKPIISVKGTTTSFPTLKESINYLSAIIFGDATLELSPSLRSLLSILMRDENSEFKDIAKPHDLRERIPEDYAPHLYLLHISLDSYYRANQILNDLKTITEVLKHEKKELTDNNTKDISQVKAEVNNIDSEVKVIESALEEYKTSESFKVLEQEISSLELELNERSSELRVLYYELKRIKSLPKGEKIDSRDIEFLFNSYKENLGSFIVKTLEEASAFKEKVESFQRSILEERRDEIQRRIDTLNKEKNALDSEYSNKMKILDTKGVFQNLKTGLGIYQEKRTRLSKTIALLENYEKHLATKKTLQKNKTDISAELDSLLNTDKSKIDSFQLTILDIHNYIMGNKECFFELQTNPVSVSNPLQVTLRIYDDGSHGIDRIKVFIYDMALLFNDQTRSRHPLFLVHDNIFETDENTRIMSLNFINSKLVSDDQEFQYIVTLNKDDVTENGSIRKTLALDVKKNTIATFTKTNKFLKKTYQEMK